MASAGGRHEIQSARDFLSSLRQEIQCHPGVGHSLLARMLTDPRTRHDFRILASQHYPLVANFTTYMELLLLRAPNSEAKRWLAKVLVDEYGERSDGDDHAASYRTFMHAAGIAPGSEENYPLHPRWSASSASTTASAPRSPSWLALAPSGRATNGRFPPCSSTS